MFTLHHHNAESHKSASKTLLRLLAVVAVVLASSWWVKSDEPLSAPIDPVHQALATRMGDFDWAAAMSAVHQR
jgi:hypothetical protein